MGIPAIATTNPAISSITIHPGSFLLKIFSALSHIHMLKIIKKITPNTL